jgi:tRNA(Ile)-lysidine synthase
MANTRNCRPIETVTQEASRLLREYVANGQRLTVAFSGGMDSSVLLHCVAALRQELQVALSTIHVHHGLSPNADSWAAHCKQRATELGIEHKTVHVVVDRASDEGLEASARQQRYAAFTQLDTDWILLAHHLDDQAETVMHNLLRGCGVMGMAGMPAVRANFLRPLLGVSREQLLEYAIHHELKWCEDESNQDFKFTRNHIRGAILPVLKTRYPSAATQLAAAASRFADAQTSLDELAEIDAGDAPVAFPFPVATFGALNLRRGCNLMRYLLAQAGQQAPAQSRLSEFVRQVREAGPDRHPQLDIGRCTLRVKNRQILLEFAPADD